MLTAEYLLKGLIFICPRAKDFPRSSSSTAAGEELYCANLYIGGCSLIRHHMNMKRDLKDYTLVICAGEERYPDYTIKEALMREKWDVITFQEHSLRSLEICHFEPYLSELIAYARELCPSAKIALHQSWGYGETKMHTMKSAGVASIEEMFDKAEENYLLALENSDADFLIPSGKVLKRLWREGYNVHRDDQHTSIGIGRYALALTWMRKLTGRSAIGNSFRDFKSFVSREEIEAAQRAVDDIVVPYEF